MSATATQHDIRTLKLELTTYRVSNGALLSRELPKRLKVASWGTNTSTKGPFTVTESTAQIMPVLQREMGYDRVGIDFNHNSVPGSPHFQPEPRHMAGYGTPAVIPGDGVYLEDIIWTPKGEEFARSYHDLSPTIIKDNRKSVVFLHSVALTPQGSVDGLTFYSAFVVPANLTFHSALSPVSTPPPSPMNPELLKAICKRLGLPETATDADIQAKLAEVDAAAAAAAAAGKSEAKGEGKGDAPGKADAGTKADTAAAAAPTQTALEAKVETLSATLTALMTKMDGNERRAMLDGALAAGKVLPLSADHLGKLDIAALKELIDKTPATVPLNQRTPGNLQPHGAPGALSAVEAEICRNLGITEADYKKFGGVS